jgi:hypothetical protein
MAKSAVLFALLLAAGTPVIAAVKSRAASPRTAAPIVQEQPFTKNCDAQRKALDALSAPPKRNARAPQPVRTSVLTFKIMVGPPGKAQPLVVQETRAPSTGNNVVSATFTSTAPPYFSQISSAGACILDPDGNIDISSYDPVDVDIVLTISSSLSAAWASPEVNAVRGARVAEAETLSPEKITHGMWPWSAAKYAPRLSSDSDVLFMTLPKDSNSNSFEYVVSYVDPTGATRDLDSLIKSH